MLAPMKNGKQLASKFKLYTFLALVVTVTAKATAPVFTDTSLGRV